nr:MAG TPA: hypothetical protein [Caudoviricetes sp.]
MCRVHRRTCQLLRKTEKTCSSLYLLLLSY